jgi:hypothetical protein
VARAETAPPPGLVVEGAEVIVHAREWATLRPDGVKRDRAPLETQHLDNAIKSPVAKVREVRLLAKAAVVCP